MNRSKKEIIRGFIKAYNSFEINGMLSFLHPDVQFKNISGGKVNVETSGKEEFERLAVRSAALFSEREQKIISYEEDSDLVKVGIQYSALLADTAAKGCKKNEKVYLTGTSEYMFKDDLIISIKDEN